LGKLNRVIILCVVILILYFVFIKDKFPIVDELPSVMKKEFVIVLDEKTNRVSLEKGGKYESIGISIDTDKTLYIANSVGKNITKFDVNKDKKEIYIKKILFNYQEGDNDKFQLIKVPYSKYKEITNGNKVKIYIDYGNGYELREYDLTNSEYETLERRGPSK
jgi:hypothetical protein